MVRLYKDLFIIYVVGEILIPVLYFVLTIVAHMHILPCLILAYILILGWLFLMQRIATRRFNRAIQNMEECRIRQGMSQIEPLLARCGRNTVFLIKADLAFGYLMLGEARNALEMLDSLPLFPEKKRWLPLQLVCESNRGSAFLMLNRLDDTEASIARFAAILENTPEKYLRRTDLRTVYRTQLCELGMARGDFEGAVELFTERLNDAATPRRRVFAHYMLSWALTHDGRVDEAREHLHFVAENGGDTWFTAAAKKRLEAM